MNVVVRAFATLGLIGALACASSRGVDRGRFDGNVYENASFGFRVTLPTGWLFVKPEQLEAAARGAIADPVARKSMERTTALFGMVDLAHPPQAGEAPRSLTATIETFDDATTGMTSETYAAATRMTLATSPSSNSEFGQWHHTTLAGQQFVVLPTVVETGGTRAHQDYYVRATNEQALGVIVVYPESESEPPREALDAFQPFP